MTTRLVIGANGYLGSHVTWQLLEQGQTVRVLIRKTADTRSIDGLAVERRYGDLFDAAALREAMTGCDVVFYCVVDTRAWLRDPAPLFRTNVEGLRQVLEVAAQMPLKRFVFTSTIGTIGRSDTRKVSEADPCNWVEEGGAYIRSRVDAENLVMRYHAERGLPAVAMCVANTYGPGDYAPTPHGAAVRDAALGKLPFYVNGLESEAVGVEDAATALILAADKGRPGERYIVSERFIAAREIYQTAADAAGVRGARFAIPLGAMYALGAIGSLIGWLTRRDLILTMTSVRLMHIMTPMDTAKARRELGWNPRPLHEAVREAALFYLRRAGRESAAAGH